MLLLLACSIFAANPVEADTPQPPPCSSLPVSPPPALVATVMPGETILHDGRLYASVAFSREIDRGDPAPEMVLLTPQGPLAAVPIRGLGRLGTECVAVRHGSPGESASYNKDCSWPLSAAGPGQYRIEVRHKGRVLATSAFSIVPTPATGGKTVLAVDPASRAHAASFGSQGLVAWLPVDASFAYRNVYIAAFRDGELAAEDGDTLRGPRPRGPGDPIYDVQPVVVRARLGQPGDWYVAIVVDRKLVRSYHLRVDGAWKRTSASPCVVSRGWTPAQALQEISLPPQLQAIVMQKVASQQPGPRRLEGRTCAVVADASAADLAKKLDALRAALGGAGTTQQTVGNETVETGSFSTTVPRWDVSPTPSDDPPTGKYKQLLDQLDRLAQPYKKVGCMDRVAGAPAWSIAR